MSCAAVIGQSRQGKGLLSACVFFARFLQERRGVGGKSNFLPRSMARYQTPSFYHGHTTSLIQNWALVPAVPQRRARRALSYSRYAKDGSWRTMCSACLTCR